MKGHDAYALVMRSAVANDYRNCLKTYLFPGHFLPNCCQFIDLYTVYSDLAVLYLGHSKYF